MSDFIAFLGGLFLMWVVMMLYQLPTESLPNVNNESHTICGVFIPNRVI